MSFGAERLKNVSDTVFYPVTVSGCVFVNWHGETDFSTGSDGKTYKEKYVAVMSDYETDWIQKDTGYSVSGTYKYVYNYASTAEYRALTSNQREIENYPIPVFKSYADAVKCTQATLTDLIESLYEPSIKFGSILKTNYSSDFSKTDATIIYPDIAHNHTSVTRYTIGTTLKCNYTGSNFSHIILPLDANGNPDTSNAPNTLEVWNAFRAYCGYSTNGTKQEFNEHSQFNTGAYNQQYLGAHNATFKVNNNNTASITFWGITTRATTPTSEPVDKANTVWSIIGSIVLTKITT